MPVTILEIKNRGSSMRKVVAFEHKEDLGVFRIRVLELAARAVEKRIKEGTINPLSFDDIWGDIEQELPQSRYQCLDLQILLGLPNENIIVMKGILPTLEKSESE